MKIRYDNDILSGEIEFVISSNKPDLIMLKFFSGY